MTIWVALYGPEGVDQPRSGEAPQAPDVVHSGIPRNARYAFTSPHVKEHSLSGEMEIIGASTQLPPSWPPQVAMHHARTGTTGALPAAAHQSTSGNAMKRTSIVRASGSGGSLA